LTRALARRHLPLCVWIRDAALDAAIAAPMPSGSPEALWERAAAAEVLGGRERGLARLRSTGIRTVDASPTELTPQLLKHYLDIKARRGL
jgi:hypothetical protein